MLTKLNTEKKLTQDKDFWLDSLSISEEGNFEQGLNIITLPGDKIRDFFDKDLWSDWRNIELHSLKKENNEFPPQQITKGLPVGTFN